MFRRTPLDKEAQLRSEFIELIRSPYVRFQFVTDEDVKKELHPEPMSKPESFPLVSKEDVNPEPMPKPKSFPLVSKEDVDPEPMPKPKSFPLVSKEDARPEPAVQLVELESPTGKKTQHHGTKCPVNDLKTRDGDTYLGDPKIAQMFLIALNFTNESTLDRAKNIVVNYLMSDIPISGSRYIQQFRIEDGVRFIELVYTDGRQGFSTAKKGTSLKLYFDPMSESVRLTVFKVLAEKTAGRVEKSGCECELYYRDLQSVTLEHCATIIGQLRKTFDAVGPIINTMYPRVEAYPVLMTSKVLDAGGAYALHVCLNCMSKRDFDSLVQAKMALVNYFLKRRHSIQAIAVNVNRVKFYVDERWNEINVDLRAYDSYDSQQVKVQFARDASSNISIAIVGNNIPDLRQEFTIPAGKFPLNTAIKCELILVELEEILDEFLFNVIKKGGTSHGVLQSRLSTRNELQLSLEPWAAPHAVPVRIPRHQHYVH